MIAVSGLSVRAGRCFLLEDISLKLEERHVYALLGDNGSGKTTLIRSLTSYFHSYSGSILYDGRELRTFSRKEREALHSLLPQSLPSPDLTVRRLLSMADGAADKLCSFGLGRLMDERVPTLSGGERQMAFLALALARPACLYAFDEPEASLDQKFRGRTEAEIRNLRDEGRIVIVSFHDISRALSIADDIIVLSGGSLAAFQSREAFLEERTAERLFGLERAQYTGEDGREGIIFIE